MQPVHDETEGLAETLGLPVETFVDLFGARWRRNDAAPDHDYDADPSGGMGEPTPWMIAGDPPQLLLRVFYHGVFIAEPEGRWAGGTHGLEYQPGKQEYVGLDEFAVRAADVVDRMLRARRRRFSYCRYCREHTPVELRAGKDVCMGCASQWQGLVY